MKALKESEYNTRIY